MTTKDSQQIAAFEAVPALKIHPGNLMGHVRIAQGTLTTSFGPVPDTPGEIRLTRMHTKAVLVSLEIANEALDSAGTGTGIGLWTTQKVSKGNAIYATNLALNIVRPFTQYLFEARDISKIGQAIWQDAGDSVDPGGFYDIVMVHTNITNPIANARIAYRIKYVFI